MIRKLFNIPTKSQQALIDADVKNIMNKCDVIANSEFKDQKEAQESHDSICPNCRARKADIVNKIRRVEGNISIEKKLFSNKTNITIDTNEINHCNLCGNGWKKFKIKYINKTDIVKVVSHYLADIIIDPKRNNRFTWKVDAIKVFDGCYAESKKITNLFMIRKN